MERVAAAAEAAHLAKQAALAERARQVAEAKGRLQTLRGQLDPTILAAVDEAVAAVRAKPHPDAPSFFVTEELLRRWVELQGTHGVAAVRNMLEQVCNMVKRYQIQYGTPYTFFFGQVKWFEDRRLSPPPQQPSRQ